MQNVLTYRLNGLLPNLGEQPQLGHSLLAELGMNGCTGQGHDYASAMQSSSCSLSKASPRDHFGSTILPVESSDRVALPPPIRSAIWSSVKPAALISEMIKGQFISAPLRICSTSRNITLQHVETQRREDYQAENAKEITKGNIMETLAERLRSVREELGYNKAELKRRAGLGSASTITELENGTISQSPQIPKIAAALGVEAVWLQSGRGPKHRGKASPLEDIDAARIAELYLQLSPSRRAAAEQMLLGLVAVEQAEKSVAP